MSTYETAASGCTPKAASDLEKPRKESTEKSHRKSTPRRPPPVWSENLLEIPRTERSRLRVELVTWDEDLPPVVRFVVLMLGRNGIWIPAPHRASLRMEELARVADALAEVAE